MIGNWRETFSRLSEMTDTQQSRFQGILAKKGLNSGKFQQGKERKSRSLEQNQFEMTRIGRAQDTECRLCTEQDRIMPEYNPTLGTWDVDTTILLGIVYISAKNVID